MPWNDRIREAAYTPPSGTRLTFDYEDVQKSVEKKTSAFEFPDVDGAYIQDFGRSGRQYPLRIFFWGDDYDLQADQFEAALLEAGVGTLEHPVYGSADVVPFGAITRRDDLKTAANQAVLEVVFWETLTTVYPSSQDDPGGEVLLAVSQFSEAAAEELESVTDLDTAIERITFKNEYQTLIDSVSSGLGSIAAVQTDVEKQFETVLQSINTGIDTLVADPLSLAFQTTLLIQAPARAAAAIEDRLTAYRDLADSLINGDGAIVTPGYDSREANTFHTRDLFATAYVTGSIVSVVNHQFQTKSEALAAAEEILSQFDAVNDWRDANYASLGDVDTGAAYQQLQEAVALTAGFLVFISFSLKQEKAITLDRARTIVDLVAELYGSVDDELDFFTQSNALSGSEILELPRGRNVVYYV